MTLQFESTLPAPSPKLIQWFEEAYRVKLPDDYRKFLQTANGGIPVQKVFDAPNNPERVLEFFLCMLEDSVEHKEGWRELGVVMTQLNERLVDDEDLLGMNVIPIAALFAGDFICLDFRQTPDAPTVVIWDHEQSEEFAPHTTHLTHTFTQFLQMLRKE